MVSVARTEEHSRGLRGRVWTPLRPRTKSSLDSVQRGNRKTPKSGLTFHKIHSLGMSLKCTNSARTERSSLFFPENHSLDFIPQSRLQKRTQSITERGIGLDAGPGI